MPTVLIATDADAVADEVAAAIEDERTTIVRLRAGAEVAVACSRASLTRLLHTTGFDRIVPVAESVDEAAKALSDAQRA